MEKSTRPSQVTMTCMCNPIYSSGKTRKRKQMSREIVQYCTGNSFDLIKYGYIYCQDCLINSLNKTQTKRGSSALTAGIQHTRMPYNQQSCRARTYGFFKTWRSHHLQEKTKAAPGENQNSPSKKECFLHQFTESDVL